jgi:hypothetical protein
MSTKVLDRSYSERSMKISGAAGASHSFSEEEKEAFSEHINHCLTEDPDLAGLVPLDSSSMDLFEKSSNGLLLCKLINLAQYDAIDERAINKGANLSIYKKTENQNLALNAAKSIGCQVINIGAQDLIEGRPHLVLGLVWQIIKIQLLGQISLNNVPELVLLLEDEETLADFLKLPAELILLRWLNYHLDRAGSSRRVKNFGTDLCVRISVVVSLPVRRCNHTPVSMPTGLRGVQPCAQQTGPRQLPADHRRVPAGPGRQGHQQRQGHGRRRLLEAQGRCQDPQRDVLSAECRINALIVCYLVAQDICDGNKKLNTTMVAQLFNTRHGLVFESERRRASMVDISKLNIDDAGDSRCVICVVLQLSAILILSSYEEQHSRLCTDSPAPWPPLQRGARVPHVDQLAEHRRRVREQLIHGLPGRR